MIALQREQGGKTMIQSTVSTALLEKMLRIHNEDDERYGVSIGEEKYVPKLDIGSYPAVISDVSLDRNALSNFGINDKIVLTFTVLLSIYEGEITEVVLKKTYWKSVTERSIYFRELSELLGKDPRKGFVMKELMGIPCEVGITHNTTEKGTFANIDTVERLSIDSNLESVEIQ